MVTSESVKSARILVVDDEESMRHYLHRTLEKAGHEVRASGSAREALEILETEAVDVLLTDIRMPGMDGLELFRRTREVSPGTGVLLMTAYGSIRSAVEAVRAGAENYLTKPFEKEDLLLSVERAAERARLRADNRMLRELLEQKGTFAGLVGRSRVMRHLFRVIDQVARQEGTVLVTGESGTGKELVARAVHARSARRSGPFVAVHCGALPEKLLQAELFGVEAGAYTGADRSRRGYVERARGGTLFLDEVGEIPMEMQPALLGFLERGEITRVGGSELLQTDVRVVAATNRMLWELVRAGRFREDLVYRLNVLPIDLPPLREHPEDIPVLVSHFLELCGRPELVVPPDVMATLQGLPFPGNVRELRNLVERLASLVEGDVVDLEDLPREILEADRSAAGATIARPYKAAMEAFERRYIEELLRKTCGNVSEAARICGLSRPGLHARIASLKIDAKAFRRRKPS